MAKGPEAGRSSWTAWAGPGHRDPGGSGAVDEAELGAAGSQGGGRGGQPRDVGAAGHCKARRRVLPGAAGRSSPETP